MEVMRPDADESYFLKQVTLSRSSNDPAAAKAWIITANTLFPNSFNLQFEAYKLEKEFKNYEEAAVHFSQIILSFTSYPVEMWNEIHALANALRVADNEITPAEEFYVKMFHHVSYDVQHKILLLTVNNSEHSVQQCKLLLLILNRFPQGAVTHSPRLLEMITEGFKHSPQKYQEMLMEEALPWIFRKVPDLSPVLVCRIYTISLEYYIRHIIDEDFKSDSNELWDKIFQVLLLCGKILRWEPFLPFNRTWGQNIYWDKLIEIVSKSPPGSTQVLFYATTLYIYSLHCYIKNCYTRPDEPESNHVLVEGFTVDWQVERSDAQSMEPPQISLTTPTSKEISKAFVHAAQCWQLLNTEQFQRDFSKLLLTLPLTPWISRFLFDLAIYFGHQEEAKELMTEMVMNKLVHNIQLLSLNLLQGNLTVKGFECIVKIITDLPATPGQMLDHLTLKVPRHMIFIPMTQKALVQYCTKSIINTLSRKLYEPNCPDQILGDLLVLLQLEYPRETLMAEQIFALITSRRSFVYRLFSAYIITIDFIEEFMHIWHSHNEDFGFDISCTPLGAGRLGKGAREEFRLIIKQQVARANENVTALIANFIAMEHLRLARDMFGKSLGF